MKHFLSPSQLGLFKECPRCFWMGKVKGIGRPRGIFPSLPGGMDNVIKPHFDRYRAAGLKALCIGHEAIVDLSAFTLSGRANKSLRGKVNRITKLGHRAELHQPPFSDDLMAELRSVSD